MSVLWSRWNHIQDIASIILWYAVMISLNDRRNINVKHKYLPTYIYIYRETEMREKRRERKRERAERAQAKLCAYFSYIVGMKLTYLGGTLWRNIPAKKREELLNIIQNTQINKPITHPWQQEMGCFLWVQSKLILPLLLQWYEQCDIDGIVQDCSNSNANWSYCSLALSHRYYHHNDAT